MKEIILALMMCVSFKALGQEKFDNYVVKKQLGIVIYKFIYDSSDKRGVLVANNIFIDGKYYPLGNKKKAIKFLEHIVIPNEPKLIDRSKKLIKIIKSSFIPDFEDFIECRLFARIIDTTSNKFYYFGGEQFYRNELNLEDKSKPLRYFYVAFGFTADLLFVVEGKEPPFYMIKWACPYTYNYTNGSSDPTVFLLKLHSTKKIRLKDRRKLELRKLNDFGYFLRFCN